MARTTFIKQHDDGTQTWYTHNQQNGVDYYYAQEYEVVPRPNAPQEYDYFPLSDIYDITADDFNTWAAEQYQPNS